MSEPERYQAAMARVMQYPVSAGGTAASAAPVKPTPFNPKEAQ